MKKEVNFYLFTLSLCVFVAMPIWIPIAAFVELCCAIGRAVNRELRTGWKSPMESRQERIDMLENLLARALIELQMAEKCMCRDCIERRAEKRIRAG